MVDVSKYVSNDSDKLYSIALMYMDNRDIDKLLSSEPLTANLNEFNIRVNVDEGRDYLIFFKNDERNFGPCAHLVDSMRNPEQFAEVVNEVKQGIIKVAPFEQIVNEKYLANFRIKKPLLTVNDIKTIIDTYGEIFTEASLEYVWFDKIPVPEAEQIMNTIPPEKIYSSSVITDKKM